MPTPAAADHDARTDDDAPDRVDVRGQRLAAALTSVVLAAALVVQGPTGIALLGLQVGVFAIAVVLGVRRSPWAVAFRVVRRLADLGPPVVTEDAGPPRFAQLCGLVVAGGGLAALLTGATQLGWVLVGVVLGLSTLLAASGLCIGCELYVLRQRVVARP